MFDPPAGPVRDTHLYFTANQTGAAIRLGDWKLFLTAPPATGKGKKKAAKVAQGEAASSGPVLYNLVADPGETNDLSAEHPEVVASLKAEAARLEAEIKEHRRPAGQIGGTK
jgi:arylsulfatase A-like enzyme